MLKASAVTTLNHTPEPEAIAVAVAWRGGLKEVPAGLIVNQEGEPMTPAMLLNIVEQLLRMAGFGMSQLAKMVEGQSGVLAELERLIREKEDQLRAKVQ
jgi:hypothetical protein